MRIALSLLSPLFYGLIVFYITFINNLLDRINAYRRTLISAHNSVICFTNYDEVQKMYKWKFKKSPWAFY